MSARIHLGGEFTILEIVGNPFFDGGFFLPFMLNGKPLAFELTEEMIRGDEMIHPRSKFTCYEEGLTETIIDSRLAQDHELEYLAMIPPGRCEVSDHLFADPIQRMRLIALHHDQVEIVKWPDALELFGHMESGT